jgi:D-glycero-D-manno-heptose 1,7-bisphosphate phosphatase
MVSHKQEKRRALLLDRDGVINEEIGYLARKEDVQFISGIFDLCRCAKELGYATVIVTNQSGIARGFYSEHQFIELMAWMKEQFVLHQASLDAIYYCPYHPEHGVGIYKKDSEDRKPNPGMIIRAQRDLDLDLNASILVGDRCVDVQAGISAGVGRVFRFNSTGQSVVCDFEYKELKRLLDLVPLL